MKNTEKIQTLSKITSDITDPVKMVLVHFLFFKFSCKMNMYIFEKHYFIQVMLMVPSIHFRLSRNIRIWII